MTKNISIIVAISDNRVIGVDNELPWKLKGDMSHFIKTTKGKPVLMGRKTFDSIGRPLPKRTNIVITRDKSFKAENVLVAYSLDEAIAMVEGEVEIMIIGGGEIYAQALPLVNKVYLTHVKVEMKGDTQFPEMDMSEWEQASVAVFSADEDNDHPFAILEYLRK
jgi:dihydrofolate reductase